MVLVFNCQLRQQIIMLLMLSTTKRKCYSDSLLVLILSSFRLMCLYYTAIGKNVIGQLDIDLSTFVSTGVSSVLRKSPTILKSLKCYVTQTDRHSDIQTDRHSDIQTDSHSDIQTDRHSDIQTDRYSLLPSVDICHII